MSRFDQIVAGEVPAEAPRRGPWRAVSRPPARGGELNPPPCITAAAAKALVPAFVRPAPESRELLKAASPPTGLAGREPPSAEDDSTLGARGSRRQPEVVEA